MHLPVLAIVSIFVPVPEPVENRLELASEHSRRIVACLCAGSVGNCGEMLLIGFDFRVLGYSVFSYLGLENFCYTIWKISRTIQPSGLLLTHLP